MCLAIPVRVDALLPNDMARVTIAGVSKAISIALVEDVRIGDYLIVHVGYALSRIDPEEAEHTLAMMREAGIMHLSGGEPVFEEVSGEPVFEEVSGEPALSGVATS